MTDVLTHYSSTNAPSHKGRSWRLGDAMLLRAAGQPVEKVQLLSFPQTAAWARNVLDLHASVDAAAEAAQVALTDAVAAREPEDPTRVHVINLRRDVFNGRRPRPSTITKAAGLLSPREQGLVDTWIRLLAKHTAITEHGRVIMDKEIVEVREAARTVLDDDKLRAAVLLQSSVLERNMDRFFDSARKVDKNARQVERTLLELLYRAAMKTSPFSTLTSVGLAQVTTDRGKTFPSPDTLNQQTQANLNVAVAARLAQVIGTRPDLRAGLRVSLSPGIRTEDDLVRYVRRRTATTNDTDAVVTLDTVHESLFYLPSGRVLRSTTEYLSTHPESTVTGLVDHILGMDDQDDSSDREQVDRLVGHFLRLGYLLLPEMQVDLHSPQPCRVLADALQTQNHDTLQHLANELNTVLALVEEFSQTHPRERAALLAQIRDLTHAMFNRLDASEDLTPRTLVYEDAYLPTRDLHVDRAAWDRDHLPALAALARILPAFDLNLPRRLTTVGFFKARYGAGGVCTDLERFCHEYQQDFFDAYSQRIMRRTAFDDDNVYQPQENWFEVAGITALDRARERAATHLDRVYKASPDVDEITLDEDFVNDVTTALDTLTGPPAPWAFFLQAADKGPSQPTTLVLNQAYSAMTVMFSRFVHGLDASTPGSSDLLRQALKDSVPAGTVLAELRGGYDTSNLNVHPELTSHELVCPGDVSLRPSDEQIPLSELTVIHAPDTDTVHLWSERLNRRVVPVYLGFLMPMALPEIQQVLLCFSPTGMAPMDLWAGTGTPLAADSVTAYPRITLHGLVLQRRMWKLDRSLFPERDTAQHPSIFYLNVQRWRRRHELPRRLFAHIDFEPDPTRAADDGAEPTEGTGRKSTRKPLAVDFENWASVQMLEQLVLAAKSRVTFKEALPDIDQLTLTDENGAPHVSELLVEIYPQEEQ